MLDARQLEHVLELMGHPSIPLAFPTSGASRLLIGFQCILAGFTFRETAGVVASFAMFDGRDTGGVIVANADVAANGSATLNMGRDGPFCRSGLFFQMIAGTLQGGVWVKV